jgi:putative FmdB family regulatory protein
MPTYSYRCTECANAFDIHQAFTDDTLTVCPTCGGVLRKVFSPVGVTFSGSGFYRTDSRAKPSSGESGSGSSGSGSGSSGSGGSGSGSSDSGGSSSSGSSKTPAATPASTSSSYSSTSGGGSTT